MKKMRNVKRLVLLTALCAIISCGGAGGGAGDKTANNKPTPVNPGNPSNPINPNNPSNPGTSSITRITAPKFTETNLATLKIRENIIYNLIKEDTKDGYPESMRSPITAMSSYYEVKKNEIGIRILSRSLKIGVPTVMDVRTGGVAIVMDRVNFNYPPYSEIQDTLRAIEKINNLTLNMEPDSYLFMFVRTEAKLSQTNLNDIISKTPISLRPTINGTNYKMVKFLGSYIKIDQNVDLDDPNDLYNQLVTTHSAIDINSDVTISGKSDNQIGVQIVDNKYDEWWKGNTNSGNINSGNINLKGNNSIGVYVQASKFWNEGTISVGKNSTGIYMLPEKGNDTDLEIDYNFGAANLRVKNESEGTITLGENSTGMYIYKPWVDVPAVIINHGAIQSTANNAVGMFANVRNQKSDPSGTDAIQTVLGNAGGWSNDGKGIELKGDKSIGMYSTGDAKYQVMNYETGKIAVGNSTDRSNPSIGIYNDNPNVTIANFGKIEIGKNSVGIASFGGTVVNYGSYYTSMDITGDGGIGMYLADGAKGFNNGIIKTEGSPKNVIGVFVGQDAEFTNNGSIIINSEGGAAIVVAGGTIKNYGDIEVSGGAVEERIQDPVITNSLSDRVVPVRKDMRIYVDSLGKTNPIGGLANLGLKGAELLIGAEATEKTNATEVTVGQDVLDPFNKSIKESNIPYWSVGSGSLIWEADPEIKDNRVEKVTLKKQSYTKFADEKTKDVAEGLDEKYVVASEKDKQVFNYMNTLRDAESLGKAYKEIAGSQYINVQQRINQTDNLLDSQISSLQKDNAGKAGHHVETFFNKDKHDFKTEEVPNTTSTAFGASYLFNNTDSNWGAYGGVAINNYKFKDKGHSKESVSMLKAGGYKKFDLSIGDLDWTLGGDVFVSQNSMKRRIMTDKVYENKADYNAYGFSVKNEISKTYELGENSTIKPYGALKIGYGSFGKIKEKDAAMGLDIKGNSYYSVKPSAGIELGYAKQVTDKTKLKASLDLAYEHELGKIDHKANKMKYVDTNKAYGKLKDAKDENRGNFRSGVKVGLETGNFNFSVNGGYDTKDKNAHVGVGIGASF
ncbi:autotransporter outer membrane beta-barrel domain-containing protein [Leptotrichia alba]|uniref:Autotransporter outer membrane beta-barrel domain-containing protein n=1 Tax=Leptotrichia alba TaxID=3239304 RepID=A0AB39V6F3_9FUSO